MSDKATYLQAASVETILGEIIDGHMIFKRDGTVYDFSPDCDRMTFNERQCCNEILRRFAALEAERDALKMEVEVAISEIQKEGVKVSTLARMTGWRDDDIVALRAERDALDARLAEAEDWIARAVDYMEPYTIGDGPRGYITVQRARYDLSEMKRFLNPQPTAE